MKLDIRGENRVGITQEVLAVLSAEGLDVAQVEVITHHIYCEIKGVRKRDLPRLNIKLRQVPGIEQAEEIDLLPGERRRMQLHTILEALDVPVLAVDGTGKIIQANRSAVAAAGLEEDRLRTFQLDHLLEDPGLMGDLQANEFTLPDREVSLAGQAYLLQATPLRERDHSEDAPSGCVILLQSPGRLGVVLSAMQRREVQGLEAIIGSSRPMKRLKQQAARVGAVEAPLLILGETGVGKELLARACHEVSPRRGSAFLALNCASLPEGLAESELFGYVPGAFTSASRSGKPGLLELADGGTLFLDEVGELTPYLQAKLLRFLQDGTFRRVGGAKEISVDVRVISATNRDLEKMASQGAFREDLFYRLNVLSLTAPPLRDRAEDIPLLAQTFLERAAAQVGRDPAPRLTGQATARLASAPWPGNVRQLENVIFRAVSLTDGPFIEADDLEIGPVGGPATDMKVEPDSYADAHEAFERDLFRRLYPKYPSSRKLADRLGVSHTTVAQKLKRYGLGR
ncbi:sigma 54-interacting transcriptional regulator [Aestuariispira insulae]|uniref:HTH-type transcriptional regulatory protein TyrR n=1 Tax=Aestuariispira insulae TaxID=1461337 RepID=A0A3D9HRA8_9PROT|nr:sigma 54-interacting transcriptional regulator [Aestuariispira insulae]RED52010.1 transcriptional regulator TyrR [Aestuariispira insulae]